MLTARERPAPVYAGPTDLRSALADADTLETPAGTLRLAMSVPEGRFVAVQVGGRVWVRRGDQQSGHGGSILGSGGWVLEEDLPVPLQWRPY